MSHLSFISCHLLTFICTQKSVSERRRWVGWMGWVGIRHASRRAGGEGLWGGRETACGAGALGWEQGATPRVRIFKKTGGVGLTVRTSRRATSHDKLNPILTCRIARALSLVLSRASGPLCTDHAGQDIAVREEWWEPNDCVRTGCLLLFASFWMYHRNPRIVERVERRELLCG
jgi:hypothetical protein